MHMIPTLLLLGLVHFWSVLPIPFKISSLPDLPSANETTLSDMGTLAGIFHGIICITSVA